MIIRPLHGADVERLTRVWRRAVEATHGFLSPADIDTIEADIGPYLSTETGLWTLEVDGEPKGFMGLSGPEIQSLFIDPDLHGRGLGRAMVNHAVAQGASWLQVNEGNPKAIGFYEALGFLTTGRRETDDAGRPFPLLIMDRNGPATESGG